MATPTKVVTGVVRASYAHVFEPFAVREDQDPKFSVVIIIPKDDEKTLNKIREAQKAALEDGKDKKFGGSIPKKWTNTLHDGDEDADLDKNPEYAGHFYMSVSNKTKPGVVDSDLQKIMDQSEVYSGCYVRVSINAFPFSASGNKGVSFGLNNVMKVSDGEPLGGVPSKAEDDFSEFGGEGDEDDLL